MCMYIHVCMYMYVYIHICMYIYIYEVELSVGGDEWLASSRFDTTPVLLQYLCVLTPIYPCSYTTTYVSSY